VRKRTRNGTSRALDVRSTGRVRIEGRFAGSARRRGGGGWWCGSEQAEDDKKRYDEEIAQYIPPPGHDARENVMAENGAAGPKRRTKRGPNAPKRASGAYVFFTNEMRPIVMEQHPGIKFVDMGRILGERWRALTPEEKTKYEAQSGEDKMRLA